MSAELADLREMLLRGIRSSKQGSHARRSPAKEAEPILEEARKGLRAYAGIHANHAEAWRLLSQAEESLLHYREAISSLEKAMQLEGTEDRKDAKRLALLRQSMLEWAELPLSPNGTDTGSGFKYYV